MDYTPIHKIPCLQDESILKMNSDTTALMKGMKIHQGDRVLDIGTNQGALLLEVAQYKPSYMVGVDINPHAIKLAQHNMQLNEIHNVELIIADITTLNFTDKFDVIVCNPPFFEIHSHTLSPHQGKQAAKFSQSLSLTQLMKVIQQNLSLKGRAYIVFRSAFLAQCFREVNVKS